MRLASFRRPQTMALGCLLLALLLLLSLIGLVGLSLRLARSQTHYPGAVRVDDRGSYTLSNIRWSDAYRTTDPPNQVYAWYINQFGLSMIIDNGFNEGCFLLAGQKERFFIERSLNVTICATPAGQTILVSQSTSIH